MSIIHVHIPLQATTEQQWENLEGDLWILYEKGTQFTASLNVTCIPETSGMV